MSGSEKERGGAVFNIGGQQGVITNVGGDQTIIGGQQNQVVLPVMELSKELAGLRQTFDGLEIPEPAKREAEEALRGAERELGRTTPDQRVLAAKLERFTHIVKVAGGLVAAGAGIVNPLQAIATLLGPLGRTIVRLLQD